MNNIKKSILGLTLGIAMIGGTSAIASTSGQQPATPCTSEQTQCVPDSCKGKKACFKKGSKHHNGKGRRHAQSRKQRQNMRFADLNLTQAQMDSVKAISKRERNAVREGVNNIRKQARENADNELRQILTPEQFTQYQANIAKMRSQGQKDGNRPHKKGNKRQGNPKANDRKGQMPRQQTNTNS